MPFLPDIIASSLSGDDPEAQIKSVIKQLNEWGRTISNESRTNITKDDSGTQRLLIGYQEDGFANGNVGVKMSQQGVDVAEATSDELIFSTDFNSFKIISTGTATVTKPAGASLATTTVAHGQAGVGGLIAIAFVDPTSSGSDKIQTPHVEFTSAGVLYGYYNLFTNPTNMVFSVATPNVVGGLFGVAFTASFKYYILRETAS